MSSESAVSKYEYSSFKLKLFNYSVDGKITNLKEDLSGVSGHYTKDHPMFNFRSISFNFFDSKQYCTAKVTFQTDNKEVDLYKCAVRFIKRLNYK